MNDEKGFPKRKVESPNPTYMSLKIRRISDLQKNCGILTTFEFEL